MVHREVFNLEGEAPPYSTSDALARKLKAQVESRFRILILTGRSKMRHRPFFARYESDESDGTEVVAETLPLALCRLALLRARKQALYD
jgi:hypothetical protein